MNYYQTKKEKARQEAIQFQNWQSKIKMSNYELGICIMHFEIVGKKYGLLKEFRTNGII